MKRSRDDEADTDDNVFKKAQTSGMKMIDELINNPLYAEVGSYLIIVTDDTGNDVEYHICTTVDHIVILDEQFAILKQVPR